MSTNGYAGRVLRVNLDGERFYDEPLDQDFLKSFVGGAGFGARYLHQEHPAKVEWSDPENRIIKNGLTRDMDAPGPRYGAAPVDGPAKGISIAKHWNMIQEIYYRTMGWDPRTGKPTPETLKNLGLEGLITEI